MRCCPNHVQSQKDCCDWDVDALGGPAAEGPYGGTVWWTLIHLRVEGKGIEVDRWNVVI